MSEIQIGYALRTQMYIFSLDWSLSVQFKSIQHMTQSLPKVELFILGVLLMR